MSFGPAQLNALTTPAGRRGWFYEQWTKGKGWHRIEIPADQCPRILPEELEDQKQELGELRFRQEYFCEFHDDQTQVFPTELIVKAFTNAISPLFGTCGRYGHSPLA